MEARRSGFYPAAAGWGQRPYLRSVPRVNEIKITVSEVDNIARRQPGPSHLGNRCDLRVCVADRFAERATLSSNSRKGSGGVTLKPEDAACEILGFNSISTLSRIGRT